MKTFILGTVFLLVCYMATDFILEPAPRCAREVVTLAVASNLAFAVKELTVAFNEEYPGVNLRVIIGSSGDLATQIIQGASVDIFISADTLYPDMLFSRGLAVESPRVYAKGIVILFSRTPRPFERGLAVLTDPEIRTIAIPHKKLAPYGAAAWEAIEHQGLEDALRRKVVQAQSNAQALQYCLTVADAGFVSKSALYSPQMESYRQEGVHWIPVDPTHYAPVKQAAVLLNQKSNALSFYRFLFSENAGSILCRNGYNL